MADTYDWVRSRRALQQRHCIVPVPPIRRRHDYDNLTEVCVGLGIGFLTSLITYRLFLHRCRRFPGPRLASLSRFHASYLSSGKSGVQYYEKLEELHRRCGDYVRTGRFLLEWHYSL